ncbi:MAG: tRNA (adenosine(37)-N6)-threonylcarbamoyltransferase complex ATPase subunit type 1 TsaE [Candidatus Rokuibacteriota bacterium]|nr:MAG: tRNA (adenosine(37)-N6)-threonylcarbamoyltransferase complex ATPase subunit type 1 TsaE [Candidatus Rokubacteria bacterium]
MSSRRSPRRSGGWVAPRAEITSERPEETEDAGERLGRTLGPGAVVALTGELGVGKTCFIQGLVRGLGVTGRATSPTFVLINQYPGRVPVYHVDAYRTESLTELIDLGLLELLGGGGVTVIEWADKLESLLPPEAIHVHIDGVGDQPRAITIRT